jgi:hypothetical protein
MPKWLFLLSFARRGKIAPTPQDVVVFIRRKLNLWGRVRSQFPAQFLRRHSLDRKKGWRQRSGGEVRKRHVRPGRGAHFLFRAGAPAHNRLESGVESEARSENPVRHQPDAEKLHPGLGETAALDSTGQGSGGAEDEVRKQP